jgi:uncharacterized SAM-binding protein YcdF (DUF218 family)
MRHVIVIALLLLLLAVGYLATTEKGAAVAMSSMPHQDALAPMGVRPTAIVLLSGGVRWRLPKAAEVQRATGLPLIVTGRNSEPYVELLRRVGVNTLRVEGNSTDTEQNAAFTSCVASHSSIRSIYLVTDSVHMRRALAWFKYYGLAVEPVNAGPPFPGTSSDAWLPSRIGWQRSKAVIHEWLGLLDFAAARLLGRRLGCPAAQ